MEDKKIDINSIIGFVLIGLIMMWYLYANQPTPEEVQKEKDKKEQVKEEQPEGLKKQEEEKTVPLDFNDSLQIAQYKSTLGPFAYSASLPTAKPDTLIFENNLVSFKISTRGGQISEARMKDFVTFDSIPVYLVKDGNTSLNLSLSTTDNRTLNTQDLFFEPSLSDKGSSKVLSMKLKVSPDKYLEYRYELKPDDYMLDFTVRSVGLGSVLNTAQPVDLKWTLKGIRHSKSVTYENRYTRLTYQYEDGKIDKLSPSGNDEETEEEVKWLSYRQHFFSSILIADKPFKKATLSSEDYVDNEEDVNIKFTKGYSASIPLEIEGGELSHNLKWFYGPTDVTVLKKYKGLDLDDSIPFGWGIFGAINKYVFTPMYNWLSGFLPFGIAIIIMTIIVRLALSPVTYKSYLSQAKMKVLRPEINEINEKFKDEAMKRQQETMKLYGKAGVSPMSGCVPALLQLPIFYALFMFFPTAFALRQKSFLWAEDLASYDVVATLPFNIPFYGDHVSLFPILASIAIFFYMLMTTGQSMQTQPGMPNMKFIMYLSPLLMLFFFNNYASGLSLYYFVSNLITIFIMLAIKKFIIDEEKIHAKIQENKKKPKRESKFQRKMREIMEQAEEHKAKGRK